MKKQTKSESYEVRDNITPIESTAPIHSKGDQQPWGGAEGSVSRMEKNKCIIFDIFHRADFEHLSLYSL